MEEGCGTILIRSLPKTSPKKVFYMKALTNSINYLIIFLLAISLSSCELAGDIFQGGIWTGVILVVVVIGVVIYGISRMFGGGK